MKDNDNIKGVIEGEVPIPEGSDYVEGTKDTGVVVAFGDSEFVWVPVPEINEIAVLKVGDENNYQGVLYNFSGSNVTLKTYNSSTPTDYGLCEPSSCWSYQNWPDKASGNWAIMNEILKIDITANSQFMNLLQYDFNKMVSSISKYKGFYVGRYETSLDENKRAKSKAGVLPATAEKSSGNTWYGLYSYQKKMAEDNRLTSVDSHMIWGSNYDAMLRWTLKGTDSVKVTSYGNAAHDLSSIYETGKETVLNRKDKINNIYDLEGNVSEWTMEAFSSNYSGGGGRKILSWWKL